MNLALAPHDPGAAPAPRPPARAGLVFDIGMYDGADSRYFLDEGFSVIAVEANPALAARARDEFSAEIAAGRMTVLNRALSDRAGEVELVVCGDDLGASSIFGDRIAHRNPATQMRVPAITFDELVVQFGVPLYVKIDIEGADRHCILAMREANRPRYLSFEADSDVAELVTHLANIVGYRKFKLIGQCTFLELGNESGLRNRLRRRLLRWLGFDEPMCVRLGGRWFNLMHSSGPAPWASDGGWYGAEELLAKLMAARQGGRLIGWYDVHAST